MKNVLAAQERALERKKKIEVVWRGFTEVVDPTAPEFNSTDLKHSLVRALKEIRKLHNLKSFNKKEEEVRNIFFIDILLHIN